MTEEAAWGYNTTSGISISSAQSESWSFGTEGSSSTDIEVWGSIANGSVNGDWDQDASPPGGLSKGDEDSYTTPPDYSYSIEGWSFTAGATDDIASGTTYIYFTGGISCDVDTTTISSEETSPWANAYAEVEAGNDVWAEFESD